MTFSFHPEAEAEFNEAIEYYEGCELGLGYDFSIEVLAAIQNIINYPIAWLIIVDDVRRCLVNRFPCGVVYSIEQDEIFILAIMNLRRQPDYWKNRQ
ncbi:MAG: type II toxin-antitoxin system RelE/ParE family toxin [Nitrospirae bacterium]|nr:type II toxin-antitoxin system RelE/ParE family toxin [Nitrospirota bacterium]